MLKSRLPEISAELPIRVGGAIHHGTEAIAADAAQRAPERTGELKNSIEARAGRSKTEGEAYGIWADWYYIFAEFGTVKESARPFMIPAAEAGKAALEAEVQTALKTL